MTLVCQDDVSLCPGGGIFKMHAVNVPIPWIFSHRKHKFTGAVSSKFSSFLASLCFYMYAIIAIKHDFPIH